MSKVTVVEKPSRQTPQRIIKIVSKASKARHFPRRRAGLSSRGDAPRAARARTPCLPRSPGRSGGAAAAAPVPALLRRRDQLLDLRRVRPELAGQPDEVRLGELDEARLVDVGDD